MSGFSFSRRQFSQIVASSTCAMSLPCVMPLSLGDSLISAREKQSKKWRPKYMLASCMYGYEKIEKILPEVSKVGASAIDIWPKVHGNQREQVDSMGVEKFAALLNRHKVTLGCITQYKLGPFGLKKEMELAKKLGCQTIVTGARGKAGLKGKELKKEIASFLEKLKPHLEHAEKNGVTIAIENHSKSLIESSESMKRFAEMNASKHLALAFAPYHLPQKTKQLVELIHACCDSIAVFYAWQHGKGCMKKMAKEDELLQMPGRGELDFKPIFEALGKKNYQGWIEIFMHPFPRGIPILDSVKKVTDEINRARSYLAKFHTNGKEKSSKS